MPCGAAEIDVTVVGETGTILHSSSATAPSQNDPVFAVAADDSLWEHTLINPAVPTEGWVLLSPAGTILSISSVTDGAGQADVFAITADHNLWERSPGLPGDGCDGTLHRLLPADRAGVNGAGQAVVFGVLSNNSVWEQNPANGTGLNVGWTQVSGVDGGPVSILSVGRRIHRGRRLRLRHHRQSQPVGGLGVRLVRAVQRLLPVD